MSWLLRGDTVLASVEVADRAAKRSRGLLGRDHLDGALLLTPAKAIHTVGMRFPIDVAYLDGDYRVLETHRVVPHRVCRPRWRARSVLEAEAGAFARWSLRAGDELTIHGPPPRAPGP